MKKWTLVEFEDGTYAVKHIFRFGYLDLEDSYYYGFWLRIDPRHWYCGTKQQCLNAIERYECKLTTHSKKVKIKSKQKLF